jgi:hypothetical protein
MEIKLDLDTEKLKAVADKNKQLHEILSFLYEEFMKNEDFKSLDQYNQMVLVEQAFVVNFTSFPAKIQLAAALALIEEDEEFNKLQSYQEKNEIRGMIKNIGVNIKLNSYTGEFVYSDEIINIAKALYKRIPNKRIIETLIGEENFKKF